MRKAIDKFKSLKTIDKISAISWIVWVISVLTFVALVIAVPHSDGISKSAQNLYANTLGASGVTVLVLLFTSLCLTVFPKVTWGNKDKGAK